MILGVDPGVTGALVLLHDDGTFHAALPMPTMTIGSSRRVNGAAVSAWLGEAAPIRAAYLEKVHAMPGGGKRKMGGSSAFTFGHAAGKIEGIIEGAGIPLTLVSPQAWKKAAGLIGEDKDAARARAIQLYPGVRLLDLKAKGQALADAMLIARFGEGLGNA